MEELEQYLEFDAAFVQVEELVKKALSSPALSIRQFTEYLGRSRGKYIRAKSLLTCAMDKQGKIHPNAVKFAATIEVLHLATLVHDDVIDDADLRRGMPTLQRQFGKKTAVICGDYLLCIALALGTSVENRGDYLDLEFPDYIRRICLGELNEHLNQNNFDLSIREYLRIISGKTAALFEASFYGGSLLVTREDRILKQYARLGRYLGMIFQLLDDCADYEEQEYAEKKPVQSDFEQGVITLPLIQALKDPFFREKAKASELELKEVNDAVRSCGGLSFTKTIARKYYKKAAYIINALDVTEYKRERLLELLNRAFRAA